MRRFIALLALGASLCLGGSAMAATSCCITPVAPVVCTAPVIATTCAPVCCTQVRVHYRHYRVCRTHFHHHRHHCR